MHKLGVERVVLARENTLEDIRAIRSAVPELGLETFIHGALCISYSGQCYMSGMISERSANRGSCAQSCRKDYVLRDASTDEILDTGYLISARDLGAYASLPKSQKPALAASRSKAERRNRNTSRLSRRTIARRWIESLPERTRRCRRSRCRISFRFSAAASLPACIREGRAATTSRDRIPITVASSSASSLESESNEILVDVSTPLVAGDGVGFEPPAGSPEKTIGFTIDDIRTISSGATTRQAIRSYVKVPTGWKVVRSFDTRLMNSARASFAGVELPPVGRTRVDVRAFGSGGSPLKLVFASGDDAVTVRSDMALVPAQKRALDLRMLREQLGRLGETEFVLGDVETSGLSEGLFIPVSELNHLRQNAIEELEQRIGWRRDGEHDDRVDKVRAAIEDISSEARKQSRYHAVHSDSGSLHDRRCNCSRGQRRDGDLVRSISSSSCAAACTRQSVA